MSFKICQNTFDNFQFMSRHRVFIDAHSSHVSRISYCFTSQKANNLTIFIDWKLIAAVLSGGNHNDSSSCSSGPESPNGQADSRTQYISATCVVVTSYSGDVASVVDEHFTRALNFNDKTSKGNLKFSIDRNVAKRFLLNFNYWNLR